MVTAYKLSYNQILDFDARAWAKNAGNKLNLWLAGRNMADLHADVIHYNGLAMALLLIG